MVNDANIRFYQTKEFTMVVNDGDRWIAAQNVTDFQKELEQEQGERRRKALRELLEQEREKLRKLSNQDPS